jgi:Fuc2NAc and GlcNAc transferase
MTYLSSLTALLLAFATTRVLVSLAPRLGLVDTPNERSLHSRPVATIGGVGLLLGIVGAIGVAYALGGGEQIGAGRLCLAGGVLLVLIRDERVAMGWLTKLAIQGTAALIMVWGTADSITLALWPIDGLWFVVIVVAILIYTQNIYNFMDGLDGLSGLEGCVVGAVLYVLFAPVSATLSILSLSVCAASLGFLVWNVPPAKIFMGDVGAHFLGLIFAWLAVAGEQYGIPFYVGITPLGAFLFDATYTLLRRMMRRENVTRAHRFHIYQRLCRSGWSPIQVDCVYVVWTGLFGATALALQSGYLSSLMVFLAAAFSVGLTVLTEVRWATVGEAA